MKHIMRFTSPSDVYTTKLSLILPLAKRLQRNLLGASRGLNVVCGVRCVRGGSVSKEHGRLSGL